MRNSQLGSVLVISLMLLASFIWISSPICDCQSIPSNAVELRVGTDMAGTSVAKFSGGGSTKQDRLKANPTIAMFVSQKIAEEAKDNGFTGFYVKIRAKTGQANPGPGAHAAIKSLTRAGFKILNIMDNTRTPRGGPKKKGGRRGRRV